MERVKVPWERYGTIAYIASNVRMFGKTALQKIVYFLQEWKRIPLGYDFDLYTYGPFSADLMGDLDYTDSLGGVKVERIATGGYSISPGDHSLELRERANDFLRTHKADLDEVINVFGKSSASRLELLATVHYSYTYYQSLGSEFSDEDVISTVSALKPGKFSDPAITNALEFLRDNKVIH